MAFEYKARKAESVEKRATQQGGDFQGFILDEFRTYAPKKGDNWIRILPPTWDEPDHYGYDVYVHYGIGPDRASAICIGKQKHPIEGTLSPCPICEARARAERDGDEDLASELKPARRVCVWILDQREPDKGPLIWPMAWTVDRDIAKISRDRRTGEVYVIDHPYDGYDVMFDKEGEQLQTKYGGFQLARRPSSVAEEHLEYVQANPLPFTLRWRDYEELKEMFDGSGMEDAGGGRGKGGGRDRGRDADERREAPSTRREPDRDPPRREPDRDSPPRRDPPRDDRRDDRREPLRDPPARRTPPPRDDDESLRRDDEALRRDDVGRREPPREREPEREPPREREPEREPPRREPPPREEAPFDGGRDRRAGAAETSTSSAAEKAAALRARFGKK